MGKHKIRGNLGASCSEQLKEKINDEHYYSLYRNKHTINSKHFDKNNGVSLRAQQGNNNSVQYGLRGKERWN